MEMLERYGGATSEPSRWPQVQDNLNLASARTTHFRGPVLPPREGVDAFGPRRAAAWSPIQVINSWQRWPNPRDRYNTDSWCLSGREVHYRSNDGQTLTAPEPLTGDFTFGARIRSLGNDDDRFGLVFGWQDPANHYRLSWEGNFGGGGYVESDGSRGLSLICELGGVPVSLINLGNAFFSRGTPYDVGVWRSGPWIGMTIARPSDHAVMVHETVQDTTFRSGLYGLWNASQPAAYDNLMVGPGPDPSVFALARVSMSAPWRGTRCY